MKLFVLTFTSFLCLSCGFIPKPWTVPLQFRRTTTSLEGWLDNLFKPVHGHPGRLRQEDLDKLYEDQQKLQRERKTHHLDKPHLHQKYAKKKEGLVESMLHPLHGRGTATSAELEDMWSAQQELLYMRREYGKSHDKLKKKYAHKSHDDLEAQRHKEDVSWEKRHHKGNPALMNQKEDDAMYIEEDKTFSFMNLLKPWQGKLKP